MIKIAKSQPTETLFARNNAE